MRQSSAILLAVLLSLLAGRTFASACEVGPATGVEAPVVTHLRAYPWTFRAPTRMALAAGSSYLVIGRPITQADDPPAALAAINAELDI